VTLEGRKALLGLALGSRESYENWLAFGRDLVERGLRAPALIVADGAPGLWKAAHELWPAAEEQRCTVHALRNVTGKLPRAPPPRAEGALVGRLRRRRSTG
jgi:putative transposase